MHLHSFSTINPCLGSATPETANLPAHLDHKQRLDQVSTNLRSVCCTKLKSLWRLEGFCCRAGSENVTKPVGTADGTESGCRTRRCLVSSKGVMCSRMSFSDKLDATRTALCWVGSAAEHKALRSHDVMPFFLEVGWAPFLSMFLYSIHQQKIGRHISNKWSGVTRVSHAVYSSSGSTNMTSWYHDFSSLHPYLHASSKCYRTLCQALQSQVEKWKKEGARKKEESLSSEGFLSYVFKYFPAFLVNSRMGISH